MNIFGLEISTAIPWLILAIVFIAIEASTVSLTTIWFAAGALLAMVCSLLGMGLTAQIIVFLLSSFVLLIFTRKLFVEKLKTGTQKTNTDALIGSEAVVIMEISPFKTGQVKAGGQVWTAVAEDGSLTIPCETQVIIKAIEGVKLVVAPV